LLVLILQLSTFCLDVHLFGFIASLLKMKLWYVDFGRTLFLKRTSLKTELPSLRCPQV